MPKSGPGIICGMKAEARLVPAQLPIGIAAGNQKRAERMARAFESKASAVISFGIAGGLSPALKPGDIVISTSVVPESGEALSSDIDLRLTLAEALPGAHEGTLLSLDHPLASASDKSRLYGATGALACDMESLGAARGAALAGLPFIAVRAIADPASRSLPGAALVGMDDEGNMRPFAVLKMLAKKPGDLPGLLALARESGAAMAALKRVGALLGRLG